MWFAASMLARLCLAKMSTNLSTLRASRKASGQNTCNRSRFNSSKSILGTMALAFSFRQECRVLCSNCAMWLELTTGGSWQTSEFCKSEETNTRPSICSPHDDSIFNWMRSLAEMKLESSPAHAIAAWYNRHRPVSNDVEIPHHCRAGATINWLVKVRKQCKSLFSSDIWRTIYDNYRGLRRIALIPCPRFAKTSVFGKALMRNLFHMRSDSSNIYYTELWTLLVDVNSVGNGVWTYVL